MTTYGTLGGLSKPCQQLMDDLGDEALLTRQFNAMELIGLEGKNTYMLFPDSAIEPVLSGVQGPKAQSIAFTVEDSGTCERIFLAGGRSLTFTTHLGTAKDGDVAYKVKKQRHWPCCFICSRPSAEVQDANGTLLGRHEDPCMWNCTIKNEFYDHEGSLRFQSVMSICQLGVCFPCCGVIISDVQDATGGSVGQVTRLQMTLWEMWSRMSKQRIQFPKGINSKDKVLLVAGMTISDAVYNSQNQS